MIPAAQTASWHPHGRWLALPSGQVHVVTLGQGPHLLLLHGFLQSSWAWRHNLDALARRFTVHAVCLPGSGWSDKPDLAYGLVPQAARMIGLLDALGVARTHVVGNSLGGALALRMALDHPGRVDRLVLVDPAGPGTYMATLFAALPHPGMAPLLGLPGVGLALRLALQWGAYPRLAVDDAVLARFLRPLRMPGGARAALAVARAFPPDIERLSARLGEIGQPTLLTWGRCDRVVPLAAVERLQRGLQDARLELYDCSGHCPMEEEPERFNRETIAFLTTTAKAEAA